MLKTASNKGEAYKVLKDMMETMPLENYIKIHGAYDAITPPGWKADIQNNHDQHLVFVRDGEGAYYFGEEKLELRKGMILFVSNNCKYRATINKDRPLEIYPNRFGIYNIISDRCDVFKSPFYLFAQIPIKEIEFYQNKFRDFYYKNSLGRTNSSIQYMNDTFLKEIFYLLYKDSENYKKDRVIDKRIKKAIDIINKNKHKNIAIQRIAIEVGLSERYFRKLFTEQCGLSPKAYQLNSKMSYAKYLLTETNYSVKEVALMIGYSDAYIFSKQYKNHYNSSPSNRQ